MFWKDWKIMKCRPTPTVGLCRLLHSAYLHTPRMCIAPWQSGAYALKQSTLYRKSRLS